MITFIARKAKKKPEVMLTFLESCRIGDETPTCKMHTGQIKFNWLVR